MAEITRTEDIIDEQARQIAADACSGVIDEQTARMRIMELIVGAQIVQFVADRAHAETWERDEMRERVHENMIERVLGDGLDLEVASHSSVLGWARTEGFRKAQWSLGEIRREKRKVRSVGDFAEEGIEPSVEGLVTPVIGAGGDDEFMDLVEGFKTQAKGTRERSRSIIAARTLLDAFRLPNLVVPESRCDRDWIEAAVSKDFGLAHRSLEAFIRIIEGEFTEEDHLIDERLLALWDDYTFEQADLLSGKPAMVCRTIVAASVSRRPRPGRKIVAKALDLVLMAGSGDGWEQYAADVVETWLERDCEAFSEFEAPGAAEALKARERAAQRALRWDSLIESGLNGEFPFGKSPEDAAAWIASVFDSVIAYPTEV